MQAFKLPLLGETKPVIDKFGYTAAIETCCLLERVSNRKADSYVKLNVKMEDYYRIKDGKDSESDG